MTLTTLLRKAARAAVWTLAAAAVSGCGNTFISSPLPDAPGLNLEQLRDIQRDPTKTNTEKLDEIRAAMNYPDTPSGTAQAQFLLSLFIP